ncbi:MAG: MBL fold metallo-hydrolase [Pseudomonadota bacterium]
MEFIVLGIGQDAGAPQIGQHEDPAWTDPRQRMWATSGALIDHRLGAQYLFDATPDIREQLHLLHTITTDSHVSVSAKHPARRERSLGLDGVFLTHAHIGHYAGLMFVGHESAGAHRLPVFAMPRMAAYLTSNGPWDQLVRFNNIELRPMTNKHAVTLSNDLVVTPFQVPHRDEYSETVGFTITGPGKRVLFLPDIDDWDRWRTEYGIDIESMLADVDVAFLDATFFDNNELPGRDMSAIPHPRLMASMQRFATLPLEQRQRVRFFHLNHTNPVRFTDSDQYKQMRSLGFARAHRGERVCLE